MELSKEIVYISIDISHKVNRSLTEEKKWVETLRFDSNVWEDFLSDKKKTTV